MNKNGHRKLLQREKLNNFPIFFAKIPTMDETERKCQKKKSQEHRIFMQSVCHCYIKNKNINAHKRRQREGSEYLCLYIGKINDLTNSLQRATVLGDRTVSAENKNWIENS